MNIPAQSMAGLVAAALFGALATGCKPEPPIPSVDPAMSETKLQFGTTTSAAPIADPRKDMSEADADLVDRIASALDAETSLHGSRIGVLAADGVVTLTGSTESADLRSMASQVALSVDGVRLVRNELAIGMET